MVTGSPGAGKTLSITSVLADLDYEVIRFNANIIKTVKDVQDIICSQMLGLKKGCTMSTVQIIRML